MQTTPLETSSSLQQNFILFNLLGISYGTLTPKTFRVPSHPHPPTIAWSKTTTAPLLEIQDLDIHRWGASKNAALARSKKEQVYRKIRGTIINKNMEHIMKKSKDGFSWFSDLSLHQRRLRKRTLGIALHCSSEGIIHDKWQVYGFMQWMCLKKAITSKQWVNG